MVYIFGMAVYKISLLKFMLVFIFIKYRHHNINDISVNTTIWNINFELPK